MRVVVSSVGRFHHFNLARELYARGHLTRLFTGYPKFKVDTVPHDVVESFPFVQSIDMSLTKMGIHRLAHSLAWFSHELLDRWVASHLPNCDIVVCNHGNGLNTYRKAKINGAYTICDCGLPHNNEVREQLTIEYNQWGGKLFFQSKQDYEKRLQEYLEADLITIPSQYVKSSFIKHGVSEEKLVVIPYGVELNLFFPDFVRKPDPIFRVIYAGGINLRKGIPYLLSALENIEIANLELILIGSIYPEIKPFLSKYHGRLQCIDHMPRAKLQRFFARGSVFVQPSVLEGLSLVMAQAMACGLPVIATHNTGAEDLYQDGAEGFIIPARDPMAIRERVITLYENPTLREQMAQASLQRVRQMGGWRSYGEKIVQVYQQLLSGS